MAPDADPYRTLGLTRGATLTEVKQAYRRLVKVYHPDAAGEAALPRFLAIQAAYDSIVGPGSASAGSGRSAARRPWDADPDRADATRRAYGGRARRTRTTGSRRPGGTASGGAPGSAGSTGSGSSGAGGSGGASDAGGGAAPRGSGGSGRPPNKATLGSTSYDGADAEPFEPDWGGASWYGTTSGTYWTLNPKEYADPRKHGPEYQARARRAAAAARGEAGLAGADGGAPPSDPTVPPDADAVSGAPASAGPEGLGPEAPAAAAPASATSAPAASPAGGSSAVPPPTHTTSSWWDATAGPAPSTEAHPSPTPPQPAPAPAPSDMPRHAPDPAPATGATANGWPWLEGARPSLPVRVGRAVLGWIPVALAIGWVGGELTGCARFSADCDGTANVVTWVLQIATLALLLVVPRLASLAAIAAIAAIGLAIPAALILSAPGAEGASPETVAVLGIVLVAAWLGGLAVGVLRAVRRVPEGLS